MATRDKATAGMPFQNPSAASWNDMVAAGEQYAESRLGNAQAPIARPRNTDIIKCKNSSGAARAKGEVLGTFGKSVTNLDPGNVHLTGAAPTTGKHFGIVLKAIPSGEYGELQLSGVCPATVTVSNITHQYAALDPGAYKLVSSAAGPVDILWQPGSTGDQECFVRIGGDGGLVTHALTPSGGIPAKVGDQMGSAVCTLQSCNSTGLLTTTAQTATIYNNTSGAVTGSKAIAALRNEAGLPVVIVEDCGA